MAHKIFKNCFMVCMLVIFLCGIIFTAVMYRQLEAQLYSELKVEAGYISAGFDDTGVDFLESLENQRRITLVGADGTVIYDSKADPAVMENHSDRVEIRQAMESGSGQGSHYSRTMTSTTLYYAERLADGRVLRLSAGQDSLIAMLVDMLSPALIAAGLVLLLSLYISSHLARQMTRPINELDLTNPGKTQLYHELAPLVKRIEEQNRTINTQIDELRRRQQEFDAIAGSMSEGLLLVDRRGSLVYSNARAMSIIAPGGGEVPAISRARCAEDICDALDFALAGERRESILSRGERLLQLIASPMVSSGQVGGVVLLILDVTERERRDELRREFSANVSHELKTPLTSISGFAELMKEGLVPPEKMREFAGDIYSEAQRLLSLVEDIMRISKLEDAPPEYDREPVGLMALARETVQRLAPLAEKDGISVEVEGSEIHTEGNRQILSEMLFNLCENAIKYNRTGGSVCVTVGTDAGRPFFSVRDTGIGIAGDERERVFERFYRADKSHSKTVGGTGLGLSIVRHGAKFHGAEIELRSEPGAGSEFIIRFPGQDQREETEYADI